ncbi:MAG: porin family protein [Bacteroidales bacterium]|nr:porin family protein [Bacteroidales bacterium]
MKNLKRVIVAILTLVAVAAPASAQFRWGLKVGMDINKLTVSKSDWKNNFDAENRTGFTGGLTSEFTIPIIGLAFDASLMYTHRVNAYTEDDGQESTYSKDYLSIPINLKYKFSLPVVSSFLVPYVFTGPEFAVLCSKKAIQDGWKSKSFDSTWNFGLGLQLLSKVQLAASYGIGMNKISEMTYAGEAVDLGRTKAWRVTLAYFF